MNMSPAKSVFFGLSAGLLVYGISANVGGMFGGSDTTANLGDTMVTGSLAPSAKQVPGGAKSSGTKLAQGANVLAPTPTPVGTTVAPVTPRTTTAQTVAPTPSASTVATATPTPVVPHTITPTPAPIATPTPSPTPTSTPATPTPEQTQTPVPPPAGTPRVVINEIAWAGTAANASDEWIELFNAGDGVVDVTGWTLYESETRIITLAGSIAPGAYYLVERTDDTTVSDIAADVSGPFGGSGLKNLPGGEDLSIRDAGGATIDSIPCSGGWFAGDSTLKATMERINASVSGTESTNWATWGTIPDSQGNTVSTGLDASGNPVKGTPKFKNSVSP